MKYLLLFSLNVCFLFSCNKKEESGTTYQMADLTIQNESAGARKEEAESSKPTTPQTPPVNTVEKKIIKDGTISIQTQDLDASKKRMDAAVQKLNAYYEGEELQNDDQILAYNLKIRIPSANFENFITGIEQGEEEIKNKSIQARDVTQEYVDTETRLSNKRAYLTRYKQLLTKASTIKDIVALEENIRTLEEEIESKIGQLKYLNDQINYSTLYVNLIKTKDYAYKPPLQYNFGERVKSALWNGWSSLADLALLLVSLWPYIIIAVVVWVIIRQLRRNKRAKTNL